MSKVQELSQSKIIEAKQLCRTFEVGGTEVHALDHVDLELNEGDYVAVMGPSGSGKSTLMNILGCLDRPDSGDYSLIGNVVSEMEDEQLSRVRNSYVGFVFQSFHLLPRLTALENVVLPARFADSGVEAIHERGRRLLDQLGLGNRLDHRPNQLSGGQRQRVALARALAANPSLLLADEPTGNLDSITAQEILELLKEFNENGQTILLVTHESEIGDQAHRVVHMRDGRIEGVVEN